LIGASAGGLVYRLLSAQASAVGVPLRAGELHRARSHLTIVRPAGSFELAQPRECFDRYALDRTAHRRRTQFWSRDKPHTSGGQMLLRRSQFAHVVSLGDGRVLILHGITQLRLAVDAEVRRLLDCFDQPRSLPEDFAELSRFVGYDVHTLAGCVAALLERGFLSDKNPEEEAAEIALQLSETTGRDPGDMLDRFRREHVEGAQAYWAASATRGLEDLATPRRRLDVALLADCDLQMEAEFLELEGRARGLDLHVGATFPDDVRWVSERKHDVILIGALRSRAAIPTWARAVGGEPFGGYIAEARGLLENLRARSPAPILIDNLPEPTLQPLGLAERGSNGHRNRFRRANLALADLTESFADVHVVDVAAALGAAGASRLLDDGLTSFTHFGSPGWMLRRPQSEKAAVHDLFPDPAPLAAELDGDPYRRERIMARAHVDGFVSALGIGLKKCVIVDLDGVLWPGVLAETGAPFDWRPETSGLYSYIGLYVGIHEALKTLKRRGIVLAAVSKNDEDVVRKLWTWPDYYPRERLLTPDDFVTWRVNWTDKAANIREIARELGFATEAFLFIDDHPVERERIRRELPEIDVWGEELFSLRRKLLSDPRLQRPYVSTEAGSRTALVKAQLGRESLRASAADEQAFLASLEIQCRVERLRLDDPVARVEELFQRTTQFNATGRKFSTGELSALVSGDANKVFTIHVRDRFADHGLVGAAVVTGREIVGFALSCRVLGLGVEHRFLEAILRELAAAGREEVVGRIVETSRNGPVRNLYRDGGFSQHVDGSWRRAVRDRRAA
jgi:FkbH-like protein